MSYIHGWEYDENTPVDEQGWRDGGMHFRDNDRVHFEFTIDEIKRVSIGYKLIPRIPLNGPISCTSVSPIPGKISLKNFRGRRPYDFFPILNRFLIL